MAALLLLRESIMRMGPFRNLVVCLLGASGVASVISPSYAGAAALHPAVARLQAGAAHAERHVAHRTQTPIEAYVFVPGLGTVVVSVKSDGRTTIAPVPAHLNRSNFSVDSHSIEMRTARFGSGTRKKRTSSACATLKQTA